MSDPDRSPTFRAFASERSHRDANASNDMGRAAAQAAILINGGAATAILAYLSKEFGPVVWCLIGYALGVGAGAVMMYFRHRALEEYHLRWQYEAYPVPDHRPQDHLAKGMMWSRRGNKAFWAAIVFFGIASAAVVLVPALVSARR